MLLEGLFAQGYWQSASLPTCTTQQPETQLYPDPHWPGTLHEPSPLHCDSVVQLLSESSPQKV
jgi:hypothetical protein